jgi:hypothetical protein
MVLLLTKKKKKKKKKPPTTTTPRCRQHKERTAGRKPIHYYSQYEYVCRWSAWKIWKGATKLECVSFLCYTTLAKIRIIIGKTVKVSLCLTNYALRHEDVWGSGCTDPRILDVGTSSRWAVSFTPRHLYPWCKYPLDKRLSGLRNWSGRRGEKRKILPLQGLELRPLGRPARTKSLYRLRYPGSHYYQY